MANNIADGVYNALPVTAGVYEKNGLKLELHFHLCDESGNPFTQTGTDGREYPIEKRMYYTIISATGAVNTKVIEMIRGWAKGWDGVDPFWFSDNDSANFVANGMVEVTLATEPAYNDPNKTYQNIKFVNELGHNANHTGGTKAVQSGDKAAIMAKYGAQLRSAIGATALKPVSAATLKKPTAPVKPAPAAPSRPAAPSKGQDIPRFQAGLAGQAEVWAAFCKEHEGETEAKLSDGWFAALDEVVPGKDQADLTSEEWNAVATKLQIVPF